MFGFDKVISYSPTLRTSPSSAKNFSECSTGVLIAKRVLFDKCISVCGLSHPAPDSAPWIECMAKLSISLMLGIFFKIASNKSYA